MDPWKFDSIVGHGKGLLYHFPLLSSHSDKLEQYGDAICSRKRASRDYLFYRRCVGDLLSSMNDVKGDVMMMYYCGCSDVMRDL